MEFLELLLSDLAPIPNSLFILSELSSFLSKLILILFFWLSLLREIYSELIVVLLSMGDSLFFELFSFFIVVILFSISGPFMLSNSIKSFSFWKFSPFFVPNSIVIFSPFFIFKTLFSSISNNNSFFPLGGIKIYFFGWKIFCSLFISTFWIITLWPTRFLFFIISLHSSIAGTQSLNKPKYKLYLTSWISSLSSSFFWLFDLFEFFLFELSFVFSIFLILIKIIFFLSLFISMHSADSISESSSNKSRISKFSKFINSFSSSSKKIDIFI